MRIYCVPGNVLFISLSKVSILVQFFQATVFPLEDKCSLKDQHFPHDLLMKGLSGKKKNNNHFCAEYMMKIDAPFFKNITSLTLLVHTMK